MMTYILLFIEFFKTGLFAVGGGLATLPFLYNISAKYPHWFTENQIIDMLAISESTPGPIGVNMATYAGFSAGGVLGGVVATIGLILPSLLIILVIAKILEKFSENIYVKASFYALRPCVCALVSVAAVNVFKVSLVDLSKFTGFANILNIINVKSVILFLLVLFLSNKLKKHPIFYIIGAAVLGILLKM